MDHTRLMNIQGIIMTNTISISNPALRWVNFSSHLQWKCLVRIWLNIGYPQGWMLKTCQRVKDKLESVVRSSILTYAHVYHFLPRWISKHVIQLDTSWIILGRVFPRFCMSLCFVWNWTGKQETWAGRCRRDSIPSWSRWPFW